MNAEDALPDATAWPPTFATPAFPRQRFKQAILGKR
jgi:hypothetical protein